MTKVAQQANGWTLYAHPLFLKQLEELIAEVGALKAAQPKTYQNKNASKRLAAISKLIQEVIPQDPGSKQFRQGDTLGTDNKHWFRAKFFQQYRLFYQFNSQHKIIVYAWVNDENTKRTYESKTDAYKVFTQMLDAGNPPSDWQSLLESAIAIDPNIDFS